MEIKEYFERYDEFVDSVTSENAKNDQNFTKHLQHLSDLLNGNYSRLDHPITYLICEVGEVADIWKKIKFMGLEYNEETRDKMIKELGDICWYLMSASHALDLPFEDIINRNIEKLKLRHPHGFSSAYLQNKKGD